MLSEEEIKKDRLKLYDILSKPTIRRQAKHLITNYRKKAKHTINKFLIFDFGMFDVVNSEKLTITRFETEQEAIDYCLDKYSGSIIPEQKKMCTEMMHKDYKHTHSYCPICGVNLKAI